MFGRKSIDTIDTLIGSSTTIEGNVRFGGGLRLDGQIRGDISAEPGQPGILVISEHARVEGQVRAARIILNGQIVGAVYASERLELQPRARITGDVYYKELEMQNGAQVSGKLAYSSSEEPVLKLAVPSSTLKLT